MENNLRTNLEHREFLVSWQTDDENNNNNNECEALTSVFVCSFILALLFGWIDAENDVRRKVVSIIFITSCE